MDKRKYKRISTAKSFEYVAKGLPVWSSSGKLWVLKRLRLADIPTLFERRYGLKDRRKG